MLFHNFLDSILLPSLAILRDHVVIRLLLDRLFQVKLVGLPLTLPIDQVNYFQPTGVPPLNHYNFIAYCSSQTHCKPTTSMLFGTHQ
jgi:hypothetical protein